MLLYWTTVAIAAVGFGISIASLIYQIQRSRFQQSIDLLFREEGDFFGGKKQRQRAKAARAAMHGDYSEMEDILDFFETVALLVKKGALDEYMVKHTFFYWINNYYELAKDHIKQRQMEDALYWRDLTQFVPKLRSLDARERNLASASDVVPTKDALARFLKEEIAEGDGQTQQS